MSETRSNRKVLSCCPLVLSGRHPSEIATGLTGKAKCQTVRRDVCGCSHRSVRGQMTQSRVPSTFLGLLLSLRTPLPFPHACNTQESQSSAMNAALLTRSQIRADTTRLQKAVWGKLPTWFPGSFDLRSNKTRHVNHLTRCAFLRLSSFPRKRLFHLASLMKSFSSLGGSCRSLIGDSRAALGNNTPDGGDTRMSRLAFINT